MSGPPGEAEAIFDSGTLCYLAVRTPRGPHLTPVVFVLDAGRIWVTTSRGSVKSRAWGRSPEAAGMVRVGDWAVTFRGRVHVYDALDPVTWPAALLAGTRIAAAGARFTLKNAPFYAGYAVDARSVPFAWSPPGRIFAAIDLTAGAVLDLRAGLVAAVWGTWEMGASFRRALEPLPRRRPLDRRVPVEVSGVLGRTGRGALALTGRRPDRPLTVLPVTWRRAASTGSYEAAIPVAFARLTGAGPRARVCLTLDRASRWRASQMKGLLLQGPAEVFLPRGRPPRGLPERHALVRLVPDRGVWWSGWASGTTVSRR